MTYYIISNRSGRIWYETKDAEEIKAKLAGMEEENPGIIEVNKLEIIEEEEK